MVSSVRSLDHETFKVSERIAKYSDGQIIYFQGDPADSVYYLRGGRVKLSATSPAGKEAVVAILQAGQFFGLGCLLQTACLRSCTAMSMGASMVNRLARGILQQKLREDIHFAESFMISVLDQFSRLEEDLIDRSLNPSEKRVARALVLLAESGEHSHRVHQVNQQTLAEIAGSSRARVSSILNKFRRLGLIDYDKTGFAVHKSLLQLHLAAKCAASH